MTKRVCLINPPWSLRKGNIWAYIRSTMPPLGLLYLAAELERNGIDVDVIDFQAEGADWNEITARIAATDHDIYGVTATTSFANAAYMVCDRIREYHPEALLVFGGVHATSLPEEALRRGADLVVRGEGEEAMLRIARGEAPSTIQGVSYLENDTVRHVGPPGLIADLSTLPIPAYHKVDLTKYRPAVGAYKRSPAISMTTTRGCPGKCTFCNSAGIKLRYRPASHVIPELELLTTKYGIKEIAFYDDTFSVFPSNLKTLCDEIVTRKIDVTWSCFARTDTVTEELLRAMKAAGCHQVMYGIEARNETIRKNIKKNISIEKNASAIALTRKVGITTRCTFMFGNPGETTETIDETIAYSIELDPDIAVYNVTIPFPGTEMFGWAKSNGYLTSENWDDYDLSQQVMRLPTISGDLLARKYRQAYRRFYGRPLFFLRTAANAVRRGEIRHLAEAGKSLASFTFKT